jgi:hypothetical protein
MIDRSIGFFGASVRNNFNTATRRALHLRQAIDETEMLSERLQYETSADQGSCSYNMTSYWTQVYGRFVPCRHLLHAGVPQAKMPHPPTLVYSQNQLEFRFVLEKTTRRGEPPAARRCDALVIMAAQSAKQLSRTREQFNEIRTWVTESFPPPTEMDAFVNNIPTAVLRLMSLGFFHDTEHTADENAVRAH